MERIKEAIQRAKAERGSQTLMPPGADEAQALPSVVAVPNPASDLERIEYRDTRIVQLDPEHLERNRIVAYDPNDSRAAVFDLLRTQVVQGMRSHGWRSLGVVSPTPACGKTLVAINLAMSLAQQASQTVLLADFDLRRPKLAEYLGLTGRHSLVDVIEGRVPLASALVNPGLPRLVVLPNHQAVTKSATVLSSPRTKALVSELKDRYESRFVVFDLPPLLPTDDAIAFMAQIDCVLLVVTQGHSTESDVKESLRLLQPFHLLGTVLNKSDSGPKKYGKYY